MSQKAHLLCCVLYIYASYIHRPQHAPNISGEPKGAKKKKKNNKIT